ncbi:oligosaccharide flippase family protein [Klebsiella pneumoniae]|uniref:oligosaccharide flippase family protein n=1 Tax=Klebsiella pneumoniae TaxID=573 RepID=UPI0024AFAED0|nr:oligosaccharide flippase family protein [Klebsiella pneumoniae]MDI7001769.1 oligosaccharide flippase family protein [Klebsiella pneumoniae]
MNKKIMSNSVWMMAEKIISIFGVIFVTSFVAKYVGPDIFGQIAFATSLFQIAMIIAQFGSDVIIFKRVSKSEGSGIKLINSTISLRFLTYVLIAMPVILVSHKSGDARGLVFILACCISCLFSALDVVSIYYDARLESKKNTIINSAGLSICLILRWLVAILELDPMFLVIPIVLTGFLPFFLRRLSFRRISHKHRMIKAVYKRKYMKYLLSAGTAFVLSSISVAIYTRMSMLLLGYLYSNSIVGVFSVAVSLAASWSFICNAFITSNLPSVFSEKNDANAMEKAAKLNQIILMIGLPIILCVSFCGYYFIDLLYGQEFLAAYIPLVILSVSTLISSLGIISARFIARFSGYKFLSKKMLSVAFFSLIVNIPLIYFYGINGAAFATLITEVISLTLFNYLFKHGVVFKMHMRSIRLIFNHKPF